MSDQPDSTDQQKELPADLRYPTDAGDGQEIPPTDDQVEEASEDSFPASDPPSFTGGSSSS